MREHDLEYHQRIRCKKVHSLPGNHDKQARKLTQDFSWIENLNEISIQGQTIVLCHYALRVWNRSHHGSWHLYGHSHGRLPESPTSLSMDVGVDIHDFRPSGEVSFTKRFQECGLEEFSALAETIPGRRNPALRGEGPRALNERDRDVTSTNGTTVVGLLVPGTILFFHNVSATCLGDRNHTL